MLTNKDVLKELMAEKGPKNLIIEELSRNYIAKGIDYRVKRHKQIFSKLFRTKMVQAS